MSTIIDDIRLGSKTAFRELFDDYYPILCVFASKYIRDEEQCKDIAQEALLTYWQNRENFTELYKVKSYLYTVTRNQCLNLIKRGKVDASYVKEISQESEAYFDDEVLRQETYLLVRKAINTLPAQMHKIIELAMQGKKNAEIAAELGIAEGTVHTLKKTAYKKLRDQLQEYFYFLLFLV